LLHQQPGFWLTVALSRAGANAGIRLGQDALNSSYNLSKNPNGARRRLQGEVRKQPSGNKGTAHPFSRIVLDKAFPLMPVSHAA
jgi:hypothetical protein